MSQAKRGVRSLDEKVGSSGRGGSFSAWKRRVSGSCKEAVWLERAHASTYSKEVDLVGMTGFR